jgi:hypothetical protein
MRFQIPGVFGVPEYSAGTTAPLTTQKRTALGDAPSSGFDTLGWDTVFTIPAPKVNACFAKPNAYPTAFQQNMTGSLADVSISGNFGAWQIAPGGSGSIICLQVPVASGTATVKTLNGSTNYPLNGGSVLIQIALEYLAQTVTPWSLPIQSASRSSNVTTVVLSSAPQEPLAVGQVIVQSGTKAAGTTSFDGQFSVTAVVNATTYQYSDNQANDTASGGTASLPDTVKNLYLYKNPPNGVSAVSVPSSATNPTIPGLNDPEILSLLGEAFALFFNSNLAMIDAVFNTVNLNMTADNAAFQWMMPTSVGYAYLDSVDGNIADAVFAVLAMVNNNDGSKNAFEVSQGGIPAGAQAGLSFGTKAFLTNMVVPSLPVAIGNGVDGSYFALSSDNSTVINTKNIPMKPVTVAATSYYPEITSLKINITGNQVQVYTMVHVNISPGIDTYAENTSFLTLSLQKTASGGQTLAFTQAAPPVQNHWTDVATWIHIVEGIVVVIGIILVAIGGYFLAAVPAIIAGIIIAIIAGVAALTPEIIAWVAGDQSGAKVGVLGSMINQATAPYAWAGGQEFQITSSGFNGVFQLGGNAFPS